MANDTSHLFKKYYSIVLDPSADVNTDKIDDDADKIAAKIAAAKIAAAEKKLAVATSLASAALSRHTDQLSWDTERDHDMAATKATNAANQLADLIARINRKQRLYDVKVFTSKGTRYISEWFTSAQFDWMTKSDISKMECEIVSEMLLKLSGKGYERAFD
jgi:hypothetical protein